MFLLATDTHFRAAGALFKLSRPQDPERQSNQQAKYSLPLQETEMEGGKATLTLTSEARRSAHH